LTGRNFFLTIPQRILGYGRYTGFNSENVLAVYTEKDKGRVSLNDVARHVLVNNETIIVEYYDRNLLVGTGLLLAVGLAYVGYNVRWYLRYRVFKSHLAIET
jgi:hypothetical protein